MESLRVTYTIQSSAAEIAARAEGVALEQSVELPRPAVRDPHIIENIIGKVESIEAVGDELFQVVIRFAAETTGYEPAQFLNVLFGNTSMQGDVRLVDFDLPAGLMDAFAGPGAGIAGLRDLAGVFDRPLTCTALKPMGFSVDVLASICGTFAQAGLDFIKDDHGLADQDFSPFADRVRACQEAVEQVYAETGHRAFYVPNLLAGPRKLWDQVKVCQDLGVKVIMLEPMLIGLPTYYEIVTSDLGMANMSHPAFGGMLNIAPELLWGKLCRLFGADAVIYPNYGGRFSYSKQACATLADNLRKPWGHLKSAFPVPAGGMQVDRVAEMVQFYGRDTILLIGGSLYMTEDALLERSSTFVKNVAAAAQDL